MATLGQKDFPHKVMLINVNKTWDRNGLNHYDAVRYSWPVSRARAEEVDFVLAISHGDIKGVFDADEWLPATKENFGEIPDHHGNWDHQEWKPGLLRSGFRGREAQNHIQKLYVGKQISKKLRGRFPIRYVGV
jgi:uncharacterized protein